MADWQNPPVADGRTPDPPYTFGIEEEFFVVNARTGNTVARLPAALLAAIRRQTATPIEREMLAAQLETTSPVFHQHDEARAFLAEARRVLAAAAAPLDLALLACGTHPLAHWREQRATDGPRYDGIMDDLQMLGRRNLVCGLHVHVALPDLGRRIDVMRRAVPFLPVILALSTSSPFWQGHRTGLMGYRLAAYDELPRTGLPPLFADAHAYQTYVEMLVHAEVIPDASYLWWAIRPSYLHPTLELRIADSCTEVEDALAIAALFRCLVRRLDCDPHLNAALTPVDYAIAAENKWRAQRYGTDGRMVCGREGRGVPFTEVLDTLLRLVAEDAAHFTCTRELAHLREIPDRGTSAHGQVALYRTARLQGHSRAEALRQVVAWLAERTARPHSAPTLLPAAAAR